MLIQERTFYANVMNQIVQYMKFCNLLAVVTYLLCLFYAILNQLFYPMGQYTTYFLAGISLLILIQVVTIFHVTKYAYHYAYSLTYNRDLYD
jgi:membrane protein YdbS with pleckstrin-like domain